MAFTDFQRKLDLVLCIDITGSMSKFFENFKYDAKKFTEQLFKQFAEKKINVSKVRIKIVAFKDYASDLNPITITDFFELPKDQEKFEGALGAINVFGGGDGPENGFEALYYAMKSDWNVGLNDRQLIILFSDKDALDLKEREGEGAYPKDMVDMEGLISMWECEEFNYEIKLRKRLRRLIVYAPSDTKYRFFCIDTDKSWFIPVDDQPGLFDFNICEIIPEIIDRCWHDDIDEEYIMFS